MTRRRMSSRLRIQFLALLMLMGTGALGLRLWWIQVAHGAEWTAQLRGSSQATVRIPSVRGEIKDRNGVTLVQNRASYEVDFYLPEMVKGYRERLGSPPLTEYRAIINGEEAKKFTFYQGDVEGKSNIEKSMDEYLRGKPGVRYLRRNAKGTIDGVLREDPPKQGANVFLTLNARIQAIAEEALRAVGRGAAVVVDPNNGNVLAMASAPSFDPNTFIPSIKAKDWKALQKDEADPLVNRAISALPPGSTFKLITALAGLRKNLATARYSCGGGVSYGDHFFQCWVAEKHYTHGTLGLMDAIKVSGDSCFYQYGNAAGIQSIDTVGKMLGLGEESGLRLTGEQTGNLPGPEWMQIHHPQERWSQAQTANVSIGQGYTLVSPLQLAMAYATIATGGLCYYPRLVDKVLKQDGSPVVDEQGKTVNFAPRIRADLRQQISQDQSEA